MPVDFTAIDFETANSSNASACSVGLVKVRDGRVVDRAGWLIRPPAGHDSFVEWNVRIHGIMAVDVVDAKLWSEQLDDLMAFAGDDLMVAHNAGFDMGVIRGACTASFLPVPEIGYLCSLQISRKTYALDSYRLPSVASAVGFDDFAHHDALADAEACAAIMIHAADRWGARDLGELASVAGLRIGRTVRVETDAGGATARSSRPAWTVPSVPAPSFPAPSSPRPALGPGGWAPPPLSY